MLDTDSARRVAVTMISSRSVDDALLELLGLSAAATASSACATCPALAPNSAAAMAAPSKELCVAGIPNVSPSSRPVAGGASKGTLPDVHPLQPLVYRGVVGSEGERPAAPRVHNPTSSAKPLISYTADQAPTAT